MLKGGERLELAGTALKVAYTPGHAKHHVSYLDEQTAMAYVGDTAGVRVSGDYLIAPTPPPDIDIEAWQDSLDTIEAWQPVSLFLTHFGPVAPARAHLARFRTTVATAADTVRELMTTPAASDEELAQQVRGADASRCAGRRCRNTKRGRRSWPRRSTSYGQGLARYWQKKQITTSNE